VTGCAACGTRAVGHGRAPTKVRDLPVAGPPAVLVWHKRRWRCPESDCDATTWSETCPAIAPRAALTARARARLAEMVNVGGDSIAAAAAAFGVGWHTAHQAVIEHTEPAIDAADRLEGVTAIGVDEKRFLNATPDHRTVFTNRPGFLGGSMSWKRGWSYASREVSGEADDASVHG
jgi:transposase